MQPPPCLLLRATLPLVCVGVLSEPFNDNRILVLYESNDVPERDPDIAVIVLDPAHDRSFTRLAYNSEE